MPFRTDASDNRFRFRPLPAPPRAAAALPLVLFFSPFNQRHLLFLPSVDRFPESALFLRQPIRRFIASTDSTVVLMARLSSASGFNLRCLDSR